MDHFDLLALPKPGGISQNDPQPYEMTVAPTGDRERPELDFLHRGDGITVDNVAYIVEFARQVRLEAKRPYWTWVYRVVKDRSNEPETDEWKGW